MCNQCGIQTKSEVSKSGHPVVMLVGRPNVGKSTLFSRLAGVHRKTGNWPATTVEVGSAEIDISGQKLELLDLPGTSSLSPISPDEKLTCDLVLHPQGADVVLVLLDASNIARCLYLMSQVKETDARVIVALTMNDVAKRRGILIDQDALAAELGAPVIEVNPRTGKGIADLEHAIVESLKTPSRPIATVDFNDAKDLARRLDWSAQLMAKVIRRTAERPTLTDRVDTLLTAPVAGLGILLAVLWLVFQATTNFAAPMQDGLDALINGTIGGATRSWLESVAADQLWLQGLVVDGIINGVGTLLTFLPVMAIMFLLLSILEDSGYMARAAVVADRIMRFAGLPGKALLPLLVGFGCNVPAVSATRSIGDARQRLLAGLVVPFTSCSARLAVYIFIAMVFFEENAGTLVFAMYVVSIALVVLGSALYRLFFFKEMKREPLLIELPPYRLPTTKFVFQDAWMRVRGFLQEAGGVVIGTVVVVWLLMSIPLGGGAFANTPVADSAYGRVSAAVAPIFTPAGFGDWHTTGALVTGFVAKEVVISSWAQNYSVDEPSDNFDSSDLAAALQQDFTESSGGHPTSAVLAFLVFLAAYTPCVATVGAQRREFGWRWTGISLGVQTMFAWVLAVAVFQILKMVGIG